MEFYSFGTALECLPKSCSFFSLSLSFSRASHSHTSPVNLLFSHFSYIFLLSSSLLAPHMLLQTPNCSLNPGFGSQIGRPSHNCSNAASGVNLYFHMRCAQTIAADRDFPIAQWTKTPPSSLLSAESMYATASGKYCRRFVLG